MRTLLTGFVLALLLLGVACSGAGQGGGVGQSEPIPKEPLPGSPAAEWGQQGGESSPSGPTSAAPGP